MIDGDVELAVEIRSRAERVKGELHDLPHERRLNIDEVLQFTTGRDRVYTRRHTSHQHTTNKLRLTDSIVSYKLSHR